MTNKDEAHRWIVLGIVISGTFMAILDSSIVNVALPHMMSAFSVDRDEIEWVATAFMLATAVTMPLVGWVVSKIGHRTLYLVSLVIFTGGSAVCSLAWSYNSLIVARVVQAVGGGAIQPVGMAIVAELFEPHERGKALGIWGTGIMIGPGIGLILGGYLTDWFNWRAIFTVNIPIGIVTFLAAAFIMRKEDESPQRPQRFDPWGFITLSVALISGLVALTEGQEKGWSSTFIVICFILAVIGFVLFIGVELTVENPLLDLKLFFYRNFTLSMALAIFRAVGLFGVVFFLPIFLESLVGYTTIDTGLWMIPSVGMMAITMPIAGRLADRYGPRWLVSLGTLLAAISLFQFGFLDPLSGPWVIIGPQILRGIGLALMMAPLLTAAINAVPRQQVATASSFLNVAQRVGGAFGIALLNTYVTNSIHVHAVREGTVLEPESSTVARAAATAMRHPHVAGLISAGGLHTAVSAVMQRATVLGFDNGFVVGGIITLLGIPLCLMLMPEEHHLRQHAARAAAEAE